MKKLEKEMLPCKKCGKRPVFYRTTFGFYISCDTNCNNDLSTWKNETAALEAWNKAQKTTFKDIRLASGMNQTQFAEYFKIPRRTVQNWDLGVNECPDYLLELIQYKLEKESVNKREDVK